MTWRKMLAHRGVLTLPTAWTSALAGAAVAGGEPGIAVGLIALSLSLFHLAAWALDAAFGTSPEAAGGRLLTAGLGLLAGGLLLGFLTGPIPGFVAFFLAANILLSGWLRRKTVFGPLMQAGTRALFYVLAGVAVAELPTAVFWPAVGLVCYCVGFGYATMSSGRGRTDLIWPMVLIGLPLVVLALLSVGDWLLMFLWLLLGLWTVRQLWTLSSGRPDDAVRAFTELVAGIALYDAILIAMAGSTWWIAALAAFALIAAMRRWLDPSAERPG